MSFSVPSLPLTLVRSTVSLSVPSLPLTLVRSTVSLSVPSLPLTLVRSQKHSESIPSLLLTLVRSTVSLSIPSLPLTLVRSPAPTLLWDCLILSDTRHGQQTATHKSREKACVTVKSKPPAETLSASQSVHSSKRDLGPLAVFHQSIRIPGGDFGPSNRVAVSQVSLSSHKVAGGKHTAVSAEYACVRQAA